VLQPERVESDVPVVQGIMAEARMIDSSHSSCQ
jgi:hypothetical protein